MSSSKRAARRRREKAARDSRDWFRRRLLFTIREPVFMGWYETVLTDLGRALTASAEVLGRRLGEAREARVIEVLRTGTMDRGCEQVVPRGSFVTLPDGFELSPANRD